MKQEIFEHEQIKYEILIGENKQDNFNLIDLAKQTDLWFHVEDLASCHIILKTDKKIREIPRQVIKRCAYLCKINSKAKTLSKCQITYTTISNVTKSNIIGQVYVDKYKTISI